MHALTLRTAFCGWFTYIIQIKRYTNSYSVNLRIFPTGSCSFYSICSTDILERTRQPHWTWFSQNYGIRLFFFCKALNIVREIAESNHWQGCLILKTTTTTTYFLSSRHHSNGRVVSISRSFISAKNLRVKKERMGFSETPLPQNWVAQLQAAIDRNCWSRTLAPQSAYASGTPHITASPWTLGFQTQHLTHSTGS